MSQQPDNNTTIVGGAPAPSLNMRFSESLSTPSIEISKSGKDTFTSFYTISGYWKCAETLSNLLHIFPTVFGAVERFFTLALATLLCDQACWTPFLISPFPCVPKCLFSLKFLWRAKLASVHPL